MSDEPVNARRPEFYRYVRDRGQRRQNLVEAADRAARGAASDPVAGEKSGRAATRAAVAAFDLAEPELTFDEWKQAAP